MAISSFLLVANRGLIPGGSVSLLLHILCFEILASFGTLELKRYFNCNYECQMPMM